MVSSFAEPPTVNYTRLQILVYLALQNKSNEVTSKFFDYLREKKSDEKIVGVDSLPSWRIEVELKDDGSRSKARRI